MREIGNALKLRESDTVSPGACVDAFLHLHLDDVSVGAARTVPIRPLVGEELPTTMVGPRTLREAKFLKSLEHKLPGTAQGGGEARERRLY